MSQARPGTVCANQQLRCVGFALCYTTCNGVKRQPRPLQVTEHTVLVHAPMSPRLPCYIQFGTLSQF